MRSACSTSAAAASPEAYIVVRGERIEAVAKSAPADAKVIELGNATVLPGLIDCHVHVEADWNDLSSTAPLRQSAPYKTLTSLKNAQEYLRRGFTTLRDAGTTDAAYNTAAVRDALRHGR